MKKHPNQKYSDAEIELVRKLYGPGMGYKRLAKKMEMPVATVQSICTYRRRSYA